MVALSLPAPVRLSLTLVQEGYHRQSRRLSLALLALGLGVGTVFSLPALAQVPLDNGTYLYGQSATPGQLGTTYVVMTLRNGRALGAFYQPNSSFDCFHGQVTGTTLATTVVDSYDQQTHGYALAWQATSTVAASQGSTPTPTLAGFHPIPDLSPLDRDILATCQAAFSL